jgi:hypothetical protein
MSKFTPREPHFGRPARSAITVDILHIGGEDIEGSFDVIDPLCGLSVRKRAEPDSRDYADGRDDQRKDKHIADDIGHRAIVHADTTTNSPASYSIRTGPPVTGS